jgi:AAA domain
LTGQENIVRFWHSVELLQPQSAPKPTTRSNQYEAVIHDTPNEQPVMPWAPKSALSGLKLPPDWVWSHTLYAYVYESRLVFDILKKAYGADKGYRETQQRESALYSVKFTQSGHMVENSFVLSSEMWFVGRVLTGKDWTRGFEADQQIAADKAKTLLEGLVSGDSLRELTKCIIQFMGLAVVFSESHQDQNKYPFRFRSQPIKHDKPDSPDNPLNSFLLDDLADIASNLSKGISSEALDQYLRKHDLLKRLNVDDDRASLALLDKLMPDAYATSCWPSERHLGLVHSQQLAVNLILSTLANSPGLMGVNGPPGTGKTTLLRDLIAAIVTSRADTLCQLRRASDGFAKNGREEASAGGKQQVCFKLNPALLGFEIVVASSNNGAVENVTLELPQRNKIDESWLPDAEYFAELGELTTGKPAWALISGALGSKARRKIFVDRYFYGQRPFSFSDKQDSQTQEEEVEKGDEEDKEEENAGPQGLLNWLNECSEMNASRSTEQRQALWQQAISDYQAFKKAESQACADAVGIRELIRSICEARKTLAEKSKLLCTIEKKLGETIAQIAYVDQWETPPSNLAYRQALMALEEHKKCKPNFLFELFNLWGKRRWKTEQKALEAERDLAFAELARIKRLNEQLNNLRENLELKTAEARQTVMQLQGEESDLKRDATELAEACQATHLVCWLQNNAIGRGDAIELAEPWFIEGWRKARAQVFIQALKLHQTFFELEASRMRSNLFLINGLLTGVPFQGLSQHAIRSAWASLFMVVPVLSSTFASFARSFGSLGVSEIGWLLVDEAGQATPQAAVGALWRSKRALMVGDPLQLKPIVTVSDALLDHMREIYRVDRHWLPNRQSAQTLADQATSWGRMAGPVGSKTWVGLPLLVHRRCDRPMHDLANRIAYDGTMVYGTISPSPEMETLSSLQTGWIQSAGPSQGNWIPAEGKTLQELLALLRADGVQAKDISVITPFTDVRKNLKQIVDNKMVFGTIHTMQGKEAAVVIMVLGGNTAASGARNWVVSEPNLLNVAATRARRRFYVIGDRNDWKRRALFCDIMDLLPIRNLPTNQAES